MISTLAGTAVPVPRTHLLCTDPDILGAPFYVMDKVPGTAYRRAADLTALGPARTRQVSISLLDTLAGLHAVDPAAVGLADFGRVDGYLTRQVRRWKKQLEGSRSRDLVGVDELHAYLEAHVPAHSGAAIVHGDFRLDNVLVDSARPGDGGGENRGADDRTTGVLDWEMATLGDPVTDVTLLVAHQELASTASAGLVADAPLADGYLTAAEAVERYADRSGRNLTHLGFCLALAYFKLVAVLGGGIHYRYIRGQTVGEGFESIGTLVEPLVAAGLVAAGLVAAGLVAAGLVAAGLAARTSS